MIEIAEYFIFVCIFTSILCVISRFWNYFILNREKPAVEWDNFVENYLSKGKVCLHF